MTRIGRTIMRTSGAGAAAAGRTCCRRTKPKRRLIGRRSYKNDMRALQTRDLLAARMDLLARLCDPEAPSAIPGLRVEAPSRIAQDPSGDMLDALRCAVQAAWSFQRRDAGYGIPPDADPLEGWIVDPGTG